MRGEKTIQLDYEIVSSKGTFAPATTITVRAPGLDQYKTHSRMQAWVAEAANGLRKAFSHDTAPAGAGEDEKDKPEEVDVDEERDVINLMATGLTVDRHAEFTQFVMDTLKNNTRLAWVGDDKTQPITDHTMLQIDQNGGIADWNRIASEFTGFFFEALVKKPKTVGAGSSPTAESHPKVISDTPKRVNSRLRN